MAKIGVYGGSFNPPHVGHILAAQEFQRALQLDLVLFVPASSPPHKTLPPSSPDPRQRLELLRLAVKDLPFARVEDLELRRQGASYTVDTLRQLRERYPGDELYLCIGTDMFQSFETWFQSREICAMAKIAMAHRAACDEQVLQAQARDFARQFGTEPILIPNTFVDVSSTQVRRMLILGGSEDYLPVSVYEAIKRQGLYGMAMDRKGLPFDALQQQSLALHKKSRMAHVIGCSQTARRLAIRYGADPDAAQRAGILHDVTKALDGWDQLRLCEKYGIILDDFEREHPKLLHAVTGAAVAQEVFGEAPEVVQAIRWHTSGKANMTTLEKIIYVADYMEPNRDFPGVEKLRQLADTDLDAALYLGLEMAVCHVREQGEIVGRHSLEAMEFLEHGKERAQAE